MSKLLVHSDLIDRIRVMSNPTRNHLESFKHMQQHTPKKESVAIVLDETSPTREEEEEKVQIIEKSDKEDYQTGSKIELVDNDNSPPPVTRKILTRAMIKMTPVKATIRAPTSQGGSSKKARKGK